MRIKCLLIIMIIGLNVYSNENKLIDSLKNIMSSQKDTDLVLTYSELAWQYRTVSLDTALIYGNMAIELSEEIDYLKGKAQAYNDVGIIYYYKNNFTKAIESYNHSLEIRKNLNDYNGLASIYLKIGIVYESTGDYAKAIENSQNAETMYEKIGSEFGVASCLNNIAVLNNNIGNNNEALKNYLKVIEIRKRINDVSGLAGTYVNMANIFIKINKYNEAIENYLMGLEISRELGEKEYVASTLNNLCVAYTNNREFLKAKDAVNEAYQIRTELGDQVGLISCLKNMSDIYIKTNEKEKALLKLNEALEISKQFDAKSELPSLYGAYTSYYESVGDFKSALNYKNLQVLYKDSILNENMLDKISELQIKYETEKKEQQLQMNILEIKQQKYKNKIQKLIFGIIASVIVIITLFIIYRIRQKQKAEYVKEQIRQDKLRFKAIIDSEEKERIRIAKELHDGLGQLLSSAKLNISSLEGCVPKEDEYLLQNSANIIDDAVKEVRSVSHNLMPTALMNYGLIDAVNDLVRKINDSKKLLVTFDANRVSSKPEKEIEIAIYRIIQEIINNMLKHSQASAIDLKLFTKNNNKLELLIKDNGVGFNPLEIEYSKGIGWQNIYSRVSILNGDINVNSQIGKGTEIKIII